MEFSDPVKPAGDAPYQASNSGLLEGKIALVTGGGSGIGRAVAMGYAAAGARVVVSDLLVGTAEATAAEIRSAGGEAAAIAADISSHDDHSALIAQIRQRFGRLDIACNNAGIPGNGELLGDCSTADWDRIIAVNLTGVFFAMRAQIQAMLHTGGTIVNVASVLGQVGAERAAAYVAAKHGVVGLTRAAALDYARCAIRINAVAPGFIDTPMLSDTFDRARMTESHPVGRLGRALDVAELVIWLSSEKASFATGGIYPVDGGYLAR